MYLMPMQNVFNRHHDKNIRQERYVTADQRTNSAPSMTGLSSHDAAKVNKMIQGVSHLQILSEQTWRSNNIKNLLEKA